MIELIVFFISAASFYFQINDGGTGLAIPNNVLIWSISSLFVLISFFLVLVRRRFFINSFVICCFSLIFLFLLISFLGFFYNPVAWASRWFSLLLSVFFVFSLLQFEASERSVFNSFYIILIALLLHSIVGVVQLIPGFLFDEYIPLSLNREAIGMFQQRNVFGSLMAFQLLLGLFLLMSNDFEYRSVILKFCLFLCVFLSGLHISLSGSRIAILTAVLGFLFISFSIYDFFIRKKFLFFSFLVFLFLGFLSGFLISDGFYKSVEKFDRLTQGDADIRFSIYKISLLAFLDKPWFGYGAEGFQWAFYQKYAEYVQIKGDVAVINSQLSHPHNEIFYWAIEFGVFAIAGISFVFYKLLAALYVLGRNIGGSYFSLMSPFIMHSLVEFPFYLSAYHWFIFLFLVYFSICGVRKSICLSAIFRFFVFFVGFFVSICVFLYSSTVLLAHQSWRDYEYHKMFPESDFQRNILSRHPYYSDNFYYLKLRNLAYDEWSHGVSTDYTIQYVNFLNERLSKSPSRSVYVDLARSYEYLNEYDLLLETVKNGLLYYPDNAILRKSLLRLDGE